MLKLFDDSIARKSAEGKLQNLGDHSKNVAEISAFVSHYPNTSKLLAYLHDIGKISTEFQTYIKNGGDRGSVIHAWQGVFLANEILAEDNPYAILLKEMIGFCITAHHNHLDDGVSPDGTTYHFDQLLKSTAEKYSFDEIQEKICESERVQLMMLFEEAKPEVRDILAQIKSVYQNRDSATFALGLWTKYLFSCLVDADRLDAYLFDIEESYVRNTTSWDSLIDIFETNISKLSSTTHMDRIRYSVSEKCKSAAERENGIYQLTVPTGGGKTLSSFRFALHHSKQHAKKRIIYVIPYLSIIEQTAQNLRSILNLSEENNVIFEHHSNIVEAEDEKSSEIRKLSSSRWDSPVILTTMVQFLESVMSAKSGKLRKFASMADAVIIFDEIQSMPIKAINCFNEVATFLSKILKTTIVLCSATQPSLESTQRNNLLLQDNCKLIDCTEEFKDIKRVQVVAACEKDCQSAADFIFEKAIENGNCLAILNTKKSALTIYHHLESKSTEFELIHLSTSMCPIHRMDKIEHMKACLSEHKKVICVSTQLIEAGVDVSFACVVREMAGLDSIAQAAGRCNRNGESSEPKNVYTFRLKDENLEKLMDIKSGQEITSKLLENKNRDVNLLEEGILTEYYKQYFDVKERQMDYITSEGESVYKMLSGNDYGKKNYKNRTGNQFSHFVPHAFHTADRNFQVIDTRTKTVVVMFGDAERLVEEYRRQPSSIVTRDKIMILKKLQHYSVALYEWELKKLSEQSAIYPLDDETGIILLCGAYYSNATGVILDGVQDNFIV